MFLVFLLASSRLCSVQSVFVGLLSKLKASSGAFSLAFFSLAIIVSVFVLSSVPSGSFNSECFLWGFFHTPSCTQIFLWFCKQVVNRLKIPQGLSTLLFHQWSEVPSRGGVRSDSPHEKLPALQRCHLSVFSKCFLELLARPSIRTLLLSGFGVPFSIM